MSQIQIGICMGLAIGVVLLAGFVEIKNYYLAKKNAKLEGENLYAEATKEVKGLDQPGVAKLLDDEYGPGKKD